VETIGVDQPQTLPADRDCDEPIGAETRGAAFSSLCLLLIGAGRTAAALADCLQRVRPRRLVVANRTVGNGRVLAERHGGEAVALDALPDWLPRADLVVSCTASERPLLTKVLVEAAMQARGDQPLFVADIALRGDVDPEVRAVDEVFVTTAGEVCADEAPERQADALLSWQQRCMRAWRSRWQRSNDAARELRRTAESARDAALEKAARLLRSGKPPEEVLAFLAHAITNKFLHPPSASLRAAWLRGDSDLLRATERLFATQAP